MKREDQGRRVISVKNKTNWGTGERLGNWVVETGLTEGRVTDSDSAICVTVLKQTALLSKRAGLRRMHNCYTDQFAVAKPFTGATAFPGACCYLPTCEEALNRPVCLSVMGASKWPRIKQWHNSQKQSAG